MINEKKKEKMKKSFRRNRKISKKTHYSLIKPGGRLHYEKGTR